MCFCVWVCRDAMPIMPILLTHTLLIYYNYFKSIKKPAIYCGLFLFALPYRLRQTKPLPVVKTKSGLV